MLLSLLLSLPLQANPLQDHKEHKPFFQERFPQLSPENYADGVYALDPIARESWEVIEESPL